jgi:hypothetical protein
MARLGYTARLAKGVQEIGGEQSDRDVTSGLPTDICGYQVHQPEHILLDSLQPWLDK